MDEKVLNAALAGLLHDVGKIEQRSLTIPRTAAPGFEDEGQPAHATYTAYFAQNYVPKAYRAAVLAGAYHHNPEKSPAQDKTISRLIALADKLSAGERVDEKTKEKNLPRQMMTIFNRISLAETRKDLVEKDRRYLPLRPLALNERIIFPGERQDKDSEGDGYQVLLDHLTRAAKQDPGDLQTYLEAMLSAMQSSAWCVPSAYYYSAPDVSLYDHSRMTAALAVCMADFPDSEINSLLTSIRNSFSNGTPLPDTKVALLIGGDISGIQKFIYTITSKEAAKTLRGRSFYLQLLTEAVLRFVLKDLGLPYTNVIYSGGGHFFLLAPVSARDKIENLRREIAEKILAHHGTSLYFALGFSEIPASGFAAGKFPEYWGRMHEELGRAKTNRYTELGSAMYEKVFAIPVQGGNPDQICSVCGADSPNTHKFTDYDEAQARRCRMCESFSDEIGSALIDSQFVALGWQTPQSTPAASFVESLQSFGLRVEFLKNEKVQPKTLDGVERITFWAFEDTNGTYPRSNGVPASGFLRYTVNLVPKEANGEITTFDELQNMVGGGQGGFKRLGVLRMDVDNLGDVFKLGLGKYATLARISTLSFQMSLFFEGWIKRICQAEKFKGKIYAVYAGGDDVFLIGPWDVMADLALKIRDDFALYTARQEDLHLSAGLAFIGGKYPIYQAAEDAEDAVDAAKRQHGKDYKNAFHFIGNTWKWKEFTEVKSKFERIVKIVSDLQGPHAIIQTLRELAELKAQKTTNGKEIWGPWQWRGAYLLKRMEERAKGSPDLAGEIQKIRTELEPDYAQINQWGAAARWAQLQTRKKSVKDDELA